VAICNHLDQVTVDVPDEVEGCEECLKTGDRWNHLRVCRSCGKVGCCDSSPNKHASAHAREEGHPIISSCEPGEDWSYCFEDQAMFVIETE
jgi:Zn-finger in ubiquitin-hydrolases and other protein